MTDSNETGSPTPPKVSSAARARRRLAIAGFVLIAVAVVTFIVALIANAVDPTYDNPFVGVLLLSPLTFVAGLNAFVWRALVGPILRSQGSNRVLFIVGVALALAVLSVIAVTVVVLVLVQLPI